MCIGNYEAFKNLAEGIQSIVVSAAVVIGGIWTLYTFSALKTKKRAETELFEQAVLDIDVNASQQRFDNSDGLYIGIVVGIINKGNRNTFLDFRKMPVFKITKVRFDEQGAGKETQVLEIQTGGYLTLRRGAAYQVPRLVQVREKGFYFVRFSVALSEEELVVHTATAKDAEYRKGEVVWSGQSYVTVS
jgi:hypothetical protein